jgi:hypothetical protein
MSIKSSREAINLLDLPQEIIAIVLFYSVWQHIVGASELRAIVRFGGVCQSLRKLLLSTPDVWRQLFVNRECCRDTKERMLLEFLDQVSCKSTVRSLDFEDIGKSSFETTFSLVDTFPNLEELEIRFCCSFRPLDFLHYLQEWTRCHLAGNCERISLKDILP